MFEVMEGSVSRRVVDMRACTCDKLYRTEYAHKQVKLGKSE